MRSLTLEGFVLDPLGLPAGGALLTTSAGGRALAGEDGAFRLELEVPQAAACLELFAESGPAAAQVRVPLAAHAQRVRQELRLTARPTDAPRWLASFGEQPGLAGENSRFALTSAEYDDGDGPALYVGGEFLVAGSASARYVARWNGQRWEGLSTGSGLSSRPSAMVVHDDGSGPELFVAGLFTRVDGEDALGIAKWNGRRWKVLGDPPVLGAFALAVHDDGHGRALYVAGGVRAGPFVVGRILKWDGEGWSQVGSDLDGVASCMASFDDGTGPALYVGGGFDHAGGVPAHDLARWNGTSWSALPGEVNDFVRTLRVHDDGGGPALYVGGSFTTVGSLTVNRIARWDGAGWSALGAGTSGNVSCLESFDDGSGPALYVGGEFARAGDMLVNRVARWDGAGWSALDDGLGGVDGTLPLAVWTLTVVREHGEATLFAAGSFAQAGVLDVAFVARWRNGTWTPLGRGLSSTVYDAVTFDDGSGPALYVGGIFQNAADQRLKHVARWNGAEWEPVGGGVRISAVSSVGALAVYDDGFGAALYAGGRFDSAGGVTVSNIARWDGSSWSRLGAGTNGPIADMVVFDDGSGPALYVCGDFGDAGGVPSRGVARWDGSSWTGLAGGMDFRVNCLGVYDDGGGGQLFAGGPFLVAGGVPVQHIARWNGSTWARVGTGIPGVVGSFAVHDDGGGAELYVGGFFSSAGGVSAHNIARWNGTRWAQVGAGTDSSVWALTSHDDGSGPALYAGGLFTMAGDMAIRRIARWDGSAWSPLESGLGAGTSKGLFTLLSFDDGHGPTLFAGGEFWSAGNSGDSNIARWGVPQRSPFVLDFETEDDFTTPLVNGQHVDTEFGRLVSLTSSGLNAGLAIFDSTVGGPNDPSQDRDLLVGSGNLLILQTENFPPDADDVFPRPNDDEDGGTMTLSFAQPLEARSIALVDIDSTDAGATVTLRDVHGRSRTFDVPANWTGDRLAAGPGRGILDLTTLDPQPGFDSTATASESVGFDPLAVVRLSFTITGSGAIDDVTLAGEGLALPRAAAWMRNGAGVNPRSLTTLSVPVLGSTWTSTLDCSAQGPGLALLEIRRSAVEEAPGSFGQVLIGGGLVQRVVRSQPGAPRSLAWNLPFDMALVGLEVHAQGVCIGGLGPGGHAGRRGVQLSNALGLRLGF